MITFNTQFVSHFLFGGFFVKNPPKIPQKSTKLDGWISKSAEFSGIRHEHHQIHLDLTPITLVLVLVGFEIRGTFFHISEP